MGVTSVKDTKKMPLKEDKHREASYGVKNEIKYMYGEKAKRKKQTVPGQKVACYQRSTPDKTDG